MKYIHNEDFTLYNDELGNGFVTQTRLAVMCGVSKKSISLRGVTLSPLKTAEVLTVSGVQGVTLYNEKQVLDTIQYYAFKGQVVAQMSLATLSEIGLKVFIHNETGFNIAHSSVQALFNQLRGYHRVIHAEWQAEGERRGLSSEELASLYISIFDSVAGAAGAWRTHKLMSLKRGTAAVDTVNHVILGNIDDALKTYWSN